LLYWYKSTNTDAPAVFYALCVAATALANLVAAEVYLLYWYKSTNTDAPAVFYALCVAATALANLVAAEVCFVGTYIYI
jgi:amino acid permease